MVRFHSTHLNILLASPTRGPLAVVVGPTTMGGLASGRGRLLVLEKYVRCTGPTYVHNRYIVVKYSGTHKNDIYKKKYKLNKFEKKTYLALLALLREV
jgi:hypothetical protein